ncbi:hypothetical protein BAE44_0020722 [Dichanthelium oligosanthes]|uniref:AB hydrolase-1 domain-containing protein n=1 Tax=Dichanthelium oligosanthes TaxID=888268 RepID=A0A1E5UZD8_9POAL|nr:hypothetical protein BAE44_0020722 [Dichanthelium oligosanthes]
MDRNWELAAPWADAKVRVPTRFIVGDGDLTYHYPGIKDYIHKGGFKADVPLLEDVVVIPGAGHFIQQEKGDELQKFNHLQGSNQPKARAVVIEGPSEGNPVGMELVISDRSMVGGPVDSTLVTSVDHVEEPPVGTAREEDLQSTHQEDILPTPANIPALINSPPVSHIEHLPLASVGTSEQSSSEIPLDFDPLVLGLLDEVAAPSQALGSSLLVDCLRQMKVLLQQSAEAQLENASQIQTLSTKSLLCFLKKYSLLCLPSVILRQYIHELRES